MEIYISKQIATASVFSNYAASAEHISEFAKHIAELVDESSTKFISIMDGDILRGAFKNVRRIPLNILKEVIYNFKYSVVVSYIELAEESFVTCIVEVFEPNFGKEASLQINAYSAECFESDSSTEFDSSTFKMIDSILDDVLSDTLEEYDFCEAFVDKDLDIYVNVDCSDSLLYD